MGKRRALNSHDFHEFETRSLESVSFHFEVIADGATPAEALNNLKQGFHLPNFDGDSDLAKYAKTRGCRLTLQDVDFGFHGLVETGPYSLDGNVVRPIHERIGNVMGRIGVLGMELEGVTTSQAKRVFAGHNMSSGNFNKYQRPQSSNQDTKPSFTYLKLKACPISGHAQIDPHVNADERMLHTHYYHYYEADKTGMGLPVTEFSGSSLQVRFTYANTTPYDTTNPLSSCKYLNTSDWDTNAQLPTNRAALLYLDEAATVSETRLASSATSDGIHGTQLDVTKTPDPSVAAVIAQIRLPIRLLFSIHPDQSTWQQFTPFYPLPGR